MSLRQAVWLLHKLLGITLIPFIPLFLIVSINYDLKGFVGRFADTWVLFLIFFITLMPAYRRQLKRVLEEVHFAKTKVFWIELMNTILSVALFAFMWVSLR